MDEFASHPVSKRFLAEGQGLADRLSETQAAETEEERFLLVAEMYGELFTICSRAIIGLETEIAQLRAR